MSNKRELEAWILRECEFKSYQQKQCSCIVWHGMLRVTCYVCGYGSGYYNIIRRTKIEIKQSKTLMRFFDFGLEVGAVVHSCAQAHWRTEDGRKKVLWKWLRLWRATLTLFDSNEN